MQNIKFYTIVIALFLCLNSFGQENALITGRISDTNKNNLNLVNITIAEYSIGTSTDANGEFILSVPSGKEITIVISCIGFEKKEIELNLDAGKKHKLNIELNPSTTELPDVVIREKRIKQSSFIRLDPKETEVIPTIRGNIEDLIKTMPGVSSSNELSSQYSVRGGNFDENLVYVNGIQIYRPFLIRSGQQEGLSFINSDLVSSILFSAGGFSAKYGDKMSSVLDIQYKKPVSFKASASGSLLGAKAHIEGATKDQKFSYLTGIRYQSNQYILKGLQTKGDYKPSFTDVQTLLNYRFNKYWELSFLGNYSVNSYKLVPQDRETKWGTISQAYKLKVYFNGQEIDRYETMLGALSLQYHPSKDLNLRLTSSAFRTTEQETYDLEGQYWIGRLESSFGNEQFGDAIAVQGVGTYINHARNNLYANVYNIEHRGSYTLDNKHLQWGVKYQHEIIDDQLKEWQMIDSAGYSIPKPPDHVGDSNPPHPSLLLNFVARKNNEISSNRYTGFIQNTWDFLGYKNDISFTAGARFNYWDFNKQFLFSPRISFAIKPNLWQKDILFRISAGYYYQPPFYREMRDRDGNINTGIRAQKSLHFVAGMDWDFMAWSRPFKFTTEVYYKYLDDLIPYEVDNVRIRYYAKNNAHGYATGIDFKVNGEFVRGIESWASLSIMKTEEYIENYYEFYDADANLTTPGNAVDSAQINLGYIRRPTDQRVNFSLFFQDYIPKNPSYKMHLRLVFGSRLPVGAPNSKQYQDDVLLPPYRRVDIGFSKQIIGEHAMRPYKGLFSYFKSLWITAEVLNLLQTYNTVSYLWIKGVDDRYYAVPNYLTPRQLNVRLIAKF